MKRFRPGLILLSLLLLMGPTSFAATDTSLTPDQENALNSLIDSLQALKATPESATKIKEMISVDTDQLKAEIEGFQSKISELKTKIEEAEQRREKLRNRLNALKSAKILLGLDSAPAATADAASPQEEPVEEKSEPEKTDTPTVAASPAPAEGDFFHSKVLPIFQNNCFGCHGPDKQKSGLRLDSLEDMIKGGDFGSVLTPGDVDKSYLVEVIRYTSETKMPPKKKLPDESIDLIVQWVKDGAHWGDDKAAAKEDSKSDESEASDVEKESADAGLSPGEIHFTTKVLPVLQNRCIECHGPEKQKSGLRLDSLEAALKGSEYGPVLEPGDPDKSPLLNVIKYDGDVVMPPKEKLPQEDIDAIKEWIQSGAPWPKTKVSDSTPVEEAVEEGHKVEVAANEIPWSFHPVQEVAADKIEAEISSGKRGGNPIDVFILKKLEEAGLTPSPPEDRVRLIRRAYYSLIGLPPTPTEVQTFISDNSPEAYEKVLDGLLDSPRYGERWARHWLDVVGFAETNGFETNTPRPNAWPYRDYVIEAFNNDKPYDRFIKEQLAGDAFGEDRATGFLVGGPMDTVKSPDIVLTKNQRANELNDMIATTCTAFLGLTVACARCHDHKFDPIAQTDYYQIQAIFAGVQHGDRGIKPDDYEERLTKAAKIRKDFAPILKKLSQYEPETNADLVLVDDSERYAESASTPRVEALVEPGDDGKNYVDGEARGQRGDPGGENRVANIGRKYTHWSEGEIAGKDLFVWRPNLSGTHRVWLSWGCGWETRSKDVSYHIDRDGDLSTTEDRERIAGIDQRYFADGADTPFGQPLWSGFQNAGIYSFENENCLVLQAGNSDNSVSIDVVAFEKVLSETEDSEANPAREIRYRPQVSPTLNEERFDPVRASAVRFNILRTNTYEPCIDELEVYTTGPDIRNVALASAGAEATASGSYDGGDIHKLKHINEGEYGNSHSWISSEVGGGWVQIDFAQPWEIDRIVWARDRDGNYQDRLAVGYRIEVMTEDGQWKTVASSDDRAPYHKGNSVSENYTFAGLTPEEAEDLRSLLSEKNAFENRIRDLEEIPKVYAGTFKDPEDTFLLHRGDPMMEREKVHPGGIVALANLPLQLPENTSEQERRLALAEWIASEDNPLTARVMVNRVWHYHFGRGLVGTPSEFGNLGVEPSHPELLDYLAKRFVDEGWSLKKLHKWILMSETYQQSSAPREDCLVVDANSKLLWRYPPHRLEAEPIRDSILMISGNLDLGMGGPGYDAFEPNTNYVHVYQPKRSFGPEEWRRMVYQFKPRMEQDETFGVFDCPDAALPAPRRTRSTTPLQALNLLNSPFILQQCGILSQELVEHAGPEVADQVDRAFQLAFSRSPTDAEVEMAEEVIREHGLPLFCRAIFNANEFLYVN